MTAVAPYPQSTNITPPFALSTPQQQQKSSSRTISGEDKARLGNARAGQKRSLTLTPRESFSMSRGGEGRTAERGDETAPRTSTPNTQSPSWIRRLSSSMSRDSGPKTPTSRPASDAVSHSNGSVAFSNAGSATPILAGNTPPPSQPNKLVKRASSVRSVNSSPFSSGGSRLPMPVFRRPATSHQRSAELHEQYSGSDQSDRMSIDDHGSRARDAQPKQYFTPRVASDEARRRHSTGIPNPIRRVYPDRRYTPILVNANRSIKTAQAEMDTGFDNDDDSAEVAKLKMQPNHASSPLPRTEELDQGQPPRRSFSIGDLLSTGPQPLWRRPSQSKGKATGSKLVRKSRQRVVSSPLAGMGSSFSRSNGGDSERPAKRRDLSDPTAARSIYSSAGNQIYQERQGHREIQLNLGDATPHSLPEDTDSSPITEVPAHAESDSLREQSRFPSASLYSTSVRPSGVSAGPSELTSTVGSDSEYRSIGDASTDYQSDTVYDSYPTRTTRSSSGRRGPHIETIFDDSPPTFSSGRSTRLKDLLHDGTFTGDEHDARFRHSTIEEEGSIVSTPVHSLHDKSVTSTPSAQRNAQQHFGSSPPAMSAMPDPDEIDWDAPDDNASSRRVGFKRSPLDKTRVVEKSLPFRFGPNLQQSHSISADTTPVRHSGATSDRANLFEWAEVQPSPSHNQSPPRPRTVHGKKDQESRGGRAAGRRAPSGMHARSHSVPVVPDVDGNRNNVVANKFGTWGVGSKAVTEDWNDDFDFEEMPPPIPEQLKLDERRIDSGHDMFVPRSIREQQENVVANISLLREWGLLIEELKELRVRAVALDMMEGRYAQAWHEVDAMIELADQESEEQTLEPRRSPPSSPGFDYTAFEEPIPHISLTTPVRPRSVVMTDVSAHEVDASAGASALNQPATPPHGTPTRPRKDSEAVARSVIAAIQSKRTVSDPTSMKPAPNPKKVPFDTATLRHIVPYVKDLKRQVKDALRETEGLYSSPRRGTSMDPDDRDENPDEPAFRSIFDGPHTEDSAAKRRARRDQAATDHDMAEGHSTDQRGELAQRMKHMNLPH